MQNECKYTVQDEAKVTAVLFPKTGEVVLTFTHIGDEVQVILPIAVALTLSTRLRLALATDTTGTVPAGSQRISQTRLPPSPRRKASK